jgi:hypothetical protein
MSGVDPYLSLDPFTNKEVFPMSDYWRPKMKIRIQLCQTVLVILSFVFATGCASVGRSFNHEKVPTLEIGALKSGEYKDIFGEPMSVQTTTNSDGKFEDIRFLYAHANMAVATARLLDLEFRDGMLNAWYYVSGFDEDRTAIELGTISKIQKAVSSKNDVQMALGKPHGKAVCPCLLPDYKERCKAAEVWMWGAINKLVTFGRNPTETVSLYIHFDNKGIVNQIETVEKVEERKGR